MEWLMEQITTNPRLVAAAIIYAVMQILKRWESFKWLPSDSGAAGSIVAAAMAAIAGVGIHFRLDAALSQSGTYVFTVSGLTDDALHGLLNDGVKTWIYSQGIFHVKDTPGALVGFVKGLLGSKGAQ